MKPYTKLLISLLVTWIITTILFFFGLWTLNEANKDSLSTTNNKTKSESISKNIKEIDGQLIEDYCDNLIIYGDIIINLKKESYTDKIQNKKPGENPFTGINNLKLF